VACISNWSFAQNVGIGTTTPAYKLDVKNGSINTDSLYRIGSLPVLTISGVRNIFVGSQAGYSNISGFECVFLGTECSYSSTQGRGSTMVGYRAGYNSTTGQGNCFFGWQAGYENADANDNSFFGVSTGTDNTGDLNTFIGHDAGTFNTTGYENTFLGSEAGGNSTGFRNVLLGANAGTQTSNLSIATAVGYRALVGCSNCLALGGNLANGGQTRVGINNPIPTTDLHIIQQTDASGDKVRGIRLQRSVNANHWRTMIDPSNNYIFEYNDNLYSYVEPVGGAFVNPSDQRLKTDINPLPDVLDKLLLLQPKTYQYIATKDAGRLSYGFLAQDVEKLFPDFVFSSENGIKGIAYSNFSVIAVKAIQEQQQQIEEQKQKIDQQQLQIEEMLKRIEFLEKKN
jgi:hypothetical protein